MYNLPQLSLALLLILCNYYAICISILTLIIGTLVFLYTFLHPYILTSFLFIFISYTNLPQLSLALLLILCNYYGICVLIYNSCNWYSCFSLYIIFIFILISMYKSTITITFLYF